jgi:hypothetical protein
VYASQVTPVLGTSQALSLPELKSKISGAVRPVHVEPFVEGLTAAKSAQEVLAVIAETEKQGWFESK